ncbi:MAG: ABC transporter permease, partial [Chloroflexota bacterium]|nr:ABC transporter permease [Chloroflexota bacterium]
MVTVREQSAPVRQPLMTAARDAGGERHRIWRRFRRYRPGLAGLAFITFLVIVAVAAPLFAPHPPTAAQSRLRGDAPSQAYLLGNDSIGRDVLSRLIYGTRVALLVGVGATAIAATIGVVIGATAGYFGGTVDSILSRVVDALMAFPTLALLITLAAVLGPSLITV